MEGGNNLEQAVALVAAANRVVQDPNSVGSALRTISLRLRGTSIEVLEEMGEETDGVVESVSKMQSKIKALTGVDIVDMNGAYKDTYTILKEIGLVWEEMSDIDQAALLELMAGKNRANTLAAILGNMEDLQGAYTTALNSEGSALQENERYLDSIQGKVDKFTNSLQTMWMNFISSDVVKVFVDIGRFLVEAIDKLGVVKSLVVGIVGYLTFSKKGKMDWLNFFQIGGAKGGAKKGDLKFLSGQALSDEIDALNKAVADGPEAFNAYKKAQESTNNGMHQMLQTTKKTADATGKITYTTADYTMALQHMTPEQIKAARNQKLFNAAIGIGIMVVTSVISAIQSYVSSIKTLEEEYTDLQSSISALKGEIESIDTELNAIQEQIDALSNKNLSFTEAEELKRLKEQSRELEKQKELQESILESRKQQNQVKSLAMINKMLKTTAANQERSAESGKTWGKVIGTVAGALLGVLTVAAVPFTGGGSLAAAGLVGSLTGAGSLALTAAGIGSYVGSELGGFAGEKWGSASKSTTGGTLIEWYESYEKAIEEANQEASEAEQKYFSDMSDKNYEKWRKKVEEANNLQTEMYNGLEDMQEYIGNLEYNDQNSEIIDGYNDLINHIDITSNKGHIDSQISAIESLQSEYYQLSKGVDENGKNVALSTAEYARYCDIVDQVLAYTPGLIQGYDEQGNAILGAAGAQLTYNQLMAESIKLLQEQRRQAAADAVSDESLEKTVKNAKEDYNDVAKEHIDTSKNPAPSIIFGEGNEALRWDEYTSTPAIEDAIGVQQSIFSNPTKFIQKNASLIAKNRKAITQNLIDRMTQEGVDQKQINQYIIEYNAWLDSLINPILAAEEKANQKIREKLYLVPQSSTNYHNLSGSQLAFINSYIMSFKDLKDKSESEIKEIRDNILDLTNSISGDEHTQKLIDDLFALDANKLPVQTYVDSFNKLWSEIVANVDLPKEQLDALKEQLFPENDEVEKMQKEVAKKLTPNSKGLATHLTLPELRIAYKYLLEEADGSMTFEEMRQKIAQYSDELDGPIVQTYSTLKQQVADFNAVVAQSAEIVLNNTKVTQEYKDSLISLGISETELSECFDKNNKLVVTNAERLQELIAKAKKNTAQNAKLAKSQARLQYYELYKEMQKYISATGEITDGKRDEILALYAEMNAIEKVIAKYSILEAQLLGATNAYDQLASAQEADEELDYGSKAEELVKVLGDAFNTAELGTEAAQVAITGLVPDELIDKTKTLDEQMDQIYKYFTKGKISKLFTIEFDDDGGISSVEMTKKNVESFVGELLKTDMGNGLGTVFQGTWDEFTLNPAIKTLEQFAEACGVTEEVAFAFLTELEKYDINWLGGDYSTFLDQFLTTTTDGKIQLAIQQIADLNAQLASGKIDAKEYAKQYGILNGNLAASKFESRTNMFGSDGSYDTNTSDNDGYFEANQKVVDAQNSLKTATEEYEKKVTDLTNAKMQGREVTEEEKKAAEDAQKAVENATTALQNAVAYRDKHFSKPSVMEIQIALDDLEKEIAAAGDTFDKALEESFELKDGYYVIKAGINTTDLENKYPGIQNYANLLNSRTQLEAYGDADSLEVTLADVKSQIDEIITLLESMTIDLNPESVKEFSKQLGELCKPKTIWANVQAFWGGLTGSSDSSSELEGTGGVNGTAHARGTAFAGGNWGAPRSETALVGELGPEMRVRGSRWELIGQNGAEFTDIKKGDIIFNHKQTEDLLSKGYITGRGKAYASGTAYRYAEGAGFTIKKNNSESYRDAKLEHFATRNVNIQSDYLTVNSQYYKDGLKQSLDAMASLNTTGSVNTFTPLTPLSQLYGNQGDGDGKDKTEELIDFIEIKLEEIEEIISKTSAELVNLVDDTTTVGNKDSLYDKLVEQEKLKEDTYSKAIDVYNKKAQEFYNKIPEKYRDMAQNGALAIEDFVGENESKHAEAINSYREWATKAHEAEVGALESITQQAAYRVDQLNDIADDYENIVGLLESKSGLIQSHMDLIEESGERLGASGYTELMKLTEDQKGKLQQERKDLQKILDDAVASGDVEKYSDEWYEMVGVINDVDEKLIQCDTDLEGFKNSIQELTWNNLDKLIERFDALDSEISHVYNRLTDNDDFVDDNGNWNDKGIAAMGVVAQQMEIAQTKAKQYGDAIDYLNKNWEKDGYSQDEYNEKLAELTDNQWESIEAYEDAKDKLVDLNKTRIEAVKDGMQKELDAYKELIDKKKEALDTEKDLYDFEKNVSKQRKNISNLERQIAALSGDTSTSATARRRKLEAELAEAKAELEDTYYDRSVENQKNALDKEYELYEESTNKEMEALDEYLKNEEQVVLDSMNTVKDNAEVVLGEIQNISEQYGVEISSSIVKPWEDGKNAISGYKESFTELTDSFADELAAIIEQEKQLQNQAEETARAVLESLGKDFDKTQKQDREEPGKDNKNEEVTKEPEKKNLSKGDTVTVKKSAKNFGSKSGNAKMASFVPGGKYTVYNTSGDQVLIGKNGVYTGWVNTKDLEGYAKGTTGVKDDQWAWIDEVGEELVLHADGSGKLAYLSKGSSVIPSDLTKKLLDLAVDPTQTLENSRPIISAPHVVNNEFNIDMNIAEVVHIEHVDNDTIPDLTKAIEKQMDKYMKGLNNQLRKYARG